MRKKIRKKGNKEILKIKYQKKEMLKDYAKIDIKDI